MNKKSAYTPPVVWTWEKENGGKFANINRPVAGPTFEQELPVGEQPLQLYSLATPSGVKATVMLEELLASGHAGAEYDAGEFLQVHTYEHVQRWANEINNRPAVKRGRIVNRNWSNPEEQLPERHTASDFDG
jgi:GST-like protein